MLFGAGAKGLFGFLVVVTLSVSYLECLKEEHVTWGSTIKLLNTNANVRLHSHDVKYGSGSGQQSVTAKRDADDHQSYWQIRQVKNPSSSSEDDDRAQERGRPVKCNSHIRLFHLATRRNLHSHAYPSPLSQNQEVSAYGENGDGDLGDNWIVDCVTGDGEVWARRDTVRLKHEVTNKYLHVAGDQYGRPISGQMEVSCYSYANGLNTWRAYEGIYIKPSQMHAGKSHDEL
jgi:dolichyl-phosphate-mannose--protein O-mannosyl transferase